MPVQDHLILQNQLDTTQNKCKILEKKLKTSRFDYLLMELRCSKAIKDASLLRDISSLNSRPVSAREFTKDLSLRVVELELELLQVTKLIQSKESNDTATPTNYLPSSDLESQPLIQCESKDIRIKILQNQVEKLQDSVTALSESNDLLSTKLDIECNLLKSAHLQIESLALDPSLDILKLDALYNGVNDSKSIPLGRLMNVQQDISKNDSSFDLFKLKEIQIKSLKEQLIEQKIIMGNFRNESHPARSQCISTQTSDPYYSGSFVPGMSIPTFQYNQPIWTELDTDLDQIDSPIDLISPGAEMFVSSIAMTSLHSFSRSNSMDILSRDIMKVSEVQAKTALNVRYRNVANSNSIQLKAKEKICEASPVKLRKLGAIKHDAINIQPELIVGDSRAGILEQESITSPVVMLNFSTPHSINIPMQSVDLEFSPINYFETVKSETTSKLQISPILFNSFDEITANAFKSRLVLSSIIPLSYTDKSIQTFEDSISACSISSIRTVDTNQNNSIIDSSARDDIYPPLLVIARASKNSQSVPNSISSTTQRSGSSETQIISSLLNRAPTLVNGVMEALQVRSYSTIYTQTPISNLERNTTVKNYQLLADENEALRSSLKRMKSAPESDSEELTKLRLDLEAAKKNYTQFELGHILYNDKRSQGKFLKLEDIIKTERATSLIEYDAKYGLLFERNDLQRKLDDAKFENKSLLDTIDATRELQERAILSEFESIRLVTSRQDAHLVLFERRLELNRWNNERISLGIADLILENYHAHEMDSIRMKLVKHKPPSLSCTFLQTEILPQSINEAVEQKNDLICFAQGTQAENVLQNNPGYNEHILQLDSYESQIHDLRTQVHQILEKSSESEKYSKIAFEKVLVGSEIALSEKKSENAKLAMRLNDSIESDASNVRISILQLSQKTSELKELQKKYYALEVRLENMVHKKSLEIMSSKESAESKKSILNENRTLSHTLEVKENELRLSQENTEHVLKKNLIMTALISEMQLENARVGYRFNVHTQTESSIDLDETFLSPEDKMQTTFIEMHNRALDEIKMLEAELISEKDKNFKLALGKEEAMTLYDSDLRIFKFQLSESKSALAQSQIRFDMQEKQRDEKNYDVLSIQNDLRSLRKSEAIMNNTITSLLNKINTLEMRLESGQSITNDMIKKKTILNEQIIQLQLELATCPALSSIYTQTFTNDSETSAEENNIGSGQAVHPIMEGSSKANSDLLNNIEQDSCQIESKGLIMNRLQNYHQIHEIRRILDLSLKEREAENIEHELKLAALKAKLKISELSAGNIFSKSIGTDFSNIRESHDMNYYVNRQSHSIAKSDEFKELYSQSDKNLRLCQNCDHLTELLRKSEEKAHSLAIKSGIRVFSDTENSQTEHSNSKILDIDTNEQNEVYSQSNEIQSLREKNDNLTASLLEFKKSHQSLALAPITRIEQWTKNSLTDNYHSESNTDEQKNSQSKEFRWLREECGQLALGLMKSEQISQLLAVNINKKGEHEIQNSQNNALRSKYTTVEQTELGYISNELQRLREKIFQLTEENLQLLALQLKRKIKTDTKPSQTENIQNSFNAESFERNQSSQSVSSNATEALKLKLLSLQYENKSVKNANARLLAENEELSLFLHAKKGPTFNTKELSNNRLNSISTLKLNFLKDRIALSLQIKTLGSKTFGEKYVVAAKELRLFLEFMICMINGLEMESGLAYVLNSPCYKLILSVTGTKSKNLFFTQLAVSLADHARSTTTNTMVRSGLHFKEQNYINSMNKHEIIISSLKDNKRKLKLAAAQLIKAARLRGKCESILYNSIPVFDRDSLPDSAERHFTNSGSQTETFCDPNLGIIQGLEYQISTMESHLNEASNVSPAETDTRWQRRVVSLNAQIIKLNHQLKKQSKNLLSISTQTDTTQYLEEGIHKLKERSESVTINDISLMKLQLSDKSEKLLLCIQELKKRTELFKNERSFLLNDMVVLKQSSQRLEIQLEKDRKEVSYLKDTMGKLLRLNNELQNRKLYYRHDDINFDSLLKTKKTTGSQTEIQKSIERSCQSDRDSFVLRSCSTQYTPIRLPENVDVSKRIIEKELDLMGDQASQSIQDSLHYYSLDDSDLSVFSESLNFDSDFEQEIENMRVMATESMRASQCVIEQYENSTKPGSVLYSSDMVNEQFENSITPESVLYFSDVVNDDEDFLIELEMMRNATKQSANAVDALFNGVKTFEITSDNESTYSFDSELELELNVIRISSAASLEATNILLNS